MKKIIQYIGFYHTVSGRHLDDRQAMMRPFRFVHHINENKDINYLTTELANSLRQMNKDINYLTILNNFVYRIDSQIFGEAAFCLPGNNSYILLNNSDRSTKN